MGSPFGGTHEYHRPRRLGRGAAHGSIVRHARQVAHLQGQDLHGQRQEATAAALAVLVPLRMRNPVTSPKIDEAPTTNVIATSMGENVPEIMCAQPRRKSQIRLISNSQEQKQGSAVHLLHRESRSPKTTVGHIGAVCTTWRNISCDTTPTT